MPSSRFEPFLTDARASVRHFFRSPAFLISAVLTLALGIGANALMFSVLYGVLLKPLPFDQPDRLVAVYSAAPGIGWKQAVLCAAQYFTYREEQRAFEDLAVWTTREATLTGSAEPERVRTLQVTDGFLGVLRVKPRIGRGFTRDDAAPGAPRRVLLTHGFWQQRFGSDPGVLGRSVTIDGRPTEVIGVLPPDFKFMESRAAVLVPLQFDRAATTIQNFSFTGIARLKPGITLEQASRDVGRMIGMVPEKFATFAGLGRTWYRDARMGPEVHPLSQDAIGDVSRLLWVLMATVGIVLLIACANVTNLFLVRTESRRQELTVRAALGAGRARIAAGLLFESVTLGLCGGVVGVGLAWGGIRLVRALAPDALPRAAEIALTPQVLLFTVLLSLLAGLFFGLLPVLKFASPRLGALRDGGRTSSDGRERHRARSLLVVAEIAMSLVLLVGSGLMVRTFLALSRVDPGFVKGDEVLTFDLAAGRPGLVGEPLAHRHEEILHRIEQIPGVRSVGLTSAPTLSGGGMSNPMLVEEFPRPDGEVVMSRRMKWISPGYFETIGTKLVAGRRFEWGEVFSFRPVAVINARLAREYWPNPGDAVGKRIRTSTQSPWREVIGVVADERDGLEEEAPPMMYYPYIIRDFFGGGISSQPVLTYVVRSSRTGSESLLREIRQVIASVDRNIPVARVRTLATIADESMAGTSFVLVMLGLAAGVSLLLGLIGIYGVISYITAQRTREVGIRMALGAQPTQVAGLFLRHGLRLTVAGIVFGVAGALGLTRMMGSLLFGVSPTDPLTYAAVSGILAAVALLAGYLPSRRAARVNPVQALRGE